MNYHLHDVEVRENWCCYYNTGLFYTRLVNQFEINITCVLSLEGHDTQVSRVSSAYQAHGDQQIKVYKINKKLF